MTAIRRAKKCIIFSGAGMSADSGIETFRTGNGFWSGLFGQFSLVYGGTPFGWKWTPVLVWGYFVTLFYEPIVNATPHAGYRALVKLEQNKFNDRNAFHVITMNVDGLHQASGTSEDKVYEVHGSVKRFRCTKCSEPMTVADPVACKNTSMRCTCGGYVRPDVTLFTESLPIAEWGKAQLAVESLRRNDVMIIVGTSSVVYPAASLPQIAKQRGAVLIEVNPDETTPLSSIVDIHLRGGAAAVLEELVNLTCDS